MGFDRYFQRGKSSGPVLVLGRSLDVIVSLPSFQPRIPIRVQDCASSTLDEPNSRSNPPRNFLAIVQPTVQIYFSRGDLRFVPTPAELWIRQN
jgi:hypothetical protein